MIILLQISGHLYLFRITKTICNSAFIVNSVESQIRPLPFVTDHARRFMDILMTFYDIWQRSHGRLLQDVFATSQKKVVATSISDQHKTSPRPKIRRLMDVFKTSCGPLGNKYVLMFFLTFDLVSFFPFCLKRYVADTSKFSVLRKEKCVRRRQMNDAIN